MDNSDLMRHGDKALTHYDIKDLYTLLHN